MYKGNGRKPKHSQEVRIQIAKEYLYGDESATEIGNRYGMTGTAIRMLAHRWRETMMEGPQVKGGARPKETDSDLVKVLRKQIAELDNKVEFHRLRAEASELMLDKAEEMFDFEIRKKCGSRQHRR